MMKYDDWAYFSFSGSGKSVFTGRLCRENEAMFQHPVQRIVYCYSILQPFLTKLAEDVPILELHEGFDSELYKNHDPSIHLMLIVDDLMSQEGIYKDLSDIFTKFSRHKQITIVYLCQNAYFKGTSSAARFNRDILTNATELCIFRNLRDHCAALSLGRAAFPDRYRWYVSVYKDATKKPYGYLYCSFHQDNREEFILRTDIFYPTETPIIYLEA